MEEIVADRAGEVFTSTGFWANLAKTNNSKSRSKMLTSVGPAFLDRHQGDYGPQPTRKSEAAMVHAFDQYRNPDCLRPRNGRPAR